MKPSTILYSLGALCFVGYFSYHVGMYQARQQAPEREDALQRELFVRDSCHNVITADLKEQVEFWKTIAHETVLVNR